MADGPGMTPEQRKEAWKDEQRMKRDVERELHEEEEAEARGPRPKRTIREMVLDERPAVIMDKVLAVGPNLLGGPDSAGKSLLARDWVLGVTTGLGWRGYAVPEARSALWVYDEGDYDLRERWVTHPMWDMPQEETWLCPAVSLRSVSDTDWLLKEYAPERPGIVVLDTIYGMGVSDGENSISDVGPVINSMKRISAEWGCACVAIGHNGHNGERRFRGHSSWRQRTEVEWHMAAGLLTCERSKITRKSSMEAAYECAYPHLHWPGAEEVLGKEAQRRAVIGGSLRADPRLSVNARAILLAPVLQLSEKQVSRLIRTAIAEAEAAAARRNK